MRLLPKKKRYKLLLFVTIVCAILSVPEILHKNKGKTISSGSVRDGKLENGYLLPYRGANFAYFSPMSYYLLDNAYCHHAVHKTIVEAYQICEATCPGIDFRLMETSNKDGGRMHLHRTHQNGYSADFMIPKIRNGEQSGVLDWIGLSHYLLGFDNDGVSTLSDGISLDLETTAKHILALDDAAAKNGLKIRKVILKIALKDDFYATPSGQQVRARGIYIVRNLSKIVDDLHDDHYHVDFEWR